MKRELTFVQEKCNKMVTSAMPPSHHLSSEDSKNSINFFSYSQIQHKLWGLFSDYYYVTLPIFSHAEVTIVIADLGVQIFGILMMIRMNRELVMDWTWIKLASSDLSKCNSNFSSISGFCKSWNFYLYPCGRRTNFVCIQNETKGKLMNTQIFPLSLLVCAHDMNVF